MKTATNASGLTLLELLITLAVFSIIGAFATPAFTKLAINNQIVTSTDMLIRLSALARSESIRRGHQVTTCLSDSESSCNPATPLKILVFADPDRSRNPTQPTDIIRSHDIGSEGLLITYNRPFLTYKPTGSASGTNGTFTVCHASGKGNMVIISTLGRARKAVDYDGDGIVEKTPGNPLAC